MKNIYILFLCLSIASVSAQSNLKKANKLFKEFSYVDASKAYEEYLEKEKSPSTQTLKNAGDSFYYIDDKRNALKWYQKLYDIQGTSIPDDYFIRYIESLKGVLDYDKADKITKEYLASKGDQKRIANYTRLKKQMDSLSKEKPLYTIRNLEINTDKSDFGPAFYGDKVVYSSSKDTTKFKEKLYNWNRQPFLNLYVAERNTANGSLFNETVFLPNAMTKYHEATVAFTPDLQTVYYSTNIVRKKKLVNDEEGTNNFKIVKGTIADGKLTKPQDIFFNNKKYSAGHPALSEDGKWLFFASDMPGGYGGSDLYVCQIAEDGTIGPPKNLGPEINTAGNDMFPSFSNGILYFASDGHFGWGGLDIYESKFKQDATFSEPKNLGAPINSNKDDFAYIVDPKDTYGYFSSNRAQGKGDDDLYYFTKEKAPCNQWVSGKVTNSKSKLPIAEATVIVADMFGDKISEVATNTFGTYRISVPCGMKVKVSATKPGHSTDEKELESKKVNGAEIKDVDFELSKYEDLVVIDGDKEKIDINPIFFDYDKSDITPQAATELDKVVFAMSKFPNIKIKIESHTDSRGKDAYNMKLSDSRAKSTRTYILSKGIDPSRIESAIGYGESRLTNKCKNGIKCTEAEHLANRRSDFIVIEK
ncbi:OmpA family protein [Flavobacterium sp. WW92]|mgnify:CR=1 FL=1|uniref:OmpA family protein n=1 Tax=unclassified Flavobacterium TaxID=196869 RepID=UPI0022255C03|nr:MULTISPECIES: OmpA family protein [unclassified Flavobacterium]WDO11462.1 OmpA family protein [Flavobacterium sp. WW92]